MLETENPENLTMFGGISPFQPYKEVAPPTPPPVKSTKKVSEKIMWNYMTLTVAQSKSSRV